MIKRALKLLAIMADELIVGVFLLLFLPAIGVRVPVSIVAIILGVLINLRTSS